MSQHYSDPTRESDKYALPDTEVFYAEDGELDLYDRDGPSEAGWYYWYCFPGCMPEGEPWGPYATEQEAIDAMREQAQE